MHVCVHADCLRLMDKKKKSLVYMYRAGCSGFMDWDK